MKRNPRERLVSRVSSEIQTIVIDAYDRYGLTDAEILQILTTSQTTILNSMIKEERDDRGETDSGTEETDPESSSLDNPPKDGPSVFSYDYG